MKKLLAMLLALTLIISCAFVFTACKDDKDDDKSDSTKKDDDNNGDNDDNTGNNGGSNTGDNNNTDNSGNNNTGNGGNNEGTNGGNNDGSSNTNVDYVITVVDNRGSAVAGAVIKFEIFVDGDYQELSATTNSEGKANVNAAPITLDAYASIYSLPEAYGKGEISEVEMAEGDTTATLTVTRLAKYTATLIDGEGNAISGINVQVCVGNQCLTGKNTDENGEVCFYVDPEKAETQTMKLQINGLTDKVPDGFSYDDTTKAYCAYYEDGESDMTVTLSAK